MDNQRITEIKERLNNRPTALIDLITAYQSDVPYLLSEITALQADNQRLREELAAYRAVNLTPEDIGSLDSLMAEVQYQLDLAIKCSDSNAVLSADLAELRGQIDAGELVEIPCKPGDIVWANKKCFEKTDRWSVYWERKPYVRCAVVGFKGTKGGLSISLHPLTERTMNTRTHKFFRLSSIGRTVFLTEESACAALHERG